MQHQRDLQIVREEAQGRIEDALSQVRSSEEKATAITRNRQPTVPTKSTLATCQATTTNTHIYNHTSAQQEITAQFLSPTTHTYSHTHKHTKDIFNLSLNNSLIGVLDKFEKSMVQQNNLLHESLRQSVAASKEYYLSNAKPCVWQYCPDFSTWLENVSRISIISCKDPESIALATSRGSLHKYVRQLHSSGKNWPAMKPLLQERFLECGNSTMAKHKLTTFRQMDLAMHEYISKFSDLVEHAYTLTSTDPASMILASNFIEGIMNPYIRNKLKSCQISNLEDIFKFALEVDQKQKIRFIFNN